MVAFKTRDFPMTDCPDRTTSVRSAGAVCSAGGVWSSWVLAGDRAGAGAGGLFTAGEFGLSFFPHIYAPPLSQISKITTLPGFPHPDPRRECADCKLAWNTNSARGEDT